MRRLVREHPILFVLAGFFLALLPLMCMRDFTPSNELRYLSIVDEALAEGKYFAFSCHGEPYADKPPFFFWLMMLCRFICGWHCMFAYSLLTFVPACVIISVMDKWTFAAYALSVRKRVASALMLATTVMFLGMTVVIRMDMMMCMWIVLSLYVFWRMCSENSHGGLRSWLLPLFIFMALFTKGPVGLIMPVVSIFVWLAYTSRLSQIGRYLGWKTWVVLSVLCALWFLGAWKDGGKEYLDNLLFHQTIDRAVNSFHHKEPFWYYGKVIWGVLAPWCIAVVPAMVMSLKGSRDGRAGNLPAFFSVCVLSCLFSLSLFSSKLSIYLGPIVPFSIYILPFWLEKNHGTLLYKISFGVPAVLLSLAGLSILISSFICLINPGIPLFSGYPFVASAAVLMGGLFLAAGCAVCLYFLLQERTFWHFPLAALSASVLMMVFCTSLKIGPLNDYIGYGNICSAVNEQENLYTLCVKRPENMSVYLGRDIMDFGVDIDGFLAERPHDGMLVVRTSAIGTNPELASFLEGMERMEYGKFLLVRLSSGRNTSDRY